MLKRNGSGRETRPSEDRKGMPLRIRLGLGAGGFAVDLGTANTLIYNTGRGIVVNEPSVVAISYTRKEIQAIGYEAKEMLGRTPVTIGAVRPLVGGVIGDFDLAEQMLKFFLKKAYARKFVWAPRIVVGVPSEVTKVEKRSIVEIGRRLRARHVHLVEQPVAAAIGVGLPVIEPAASMVVDVGGGTTDIAVISLCGIVYSRTLRLAGDAMDQALISYLKRKHNLLIGERTAERIKIELGSALPLEKGRVMQVKGRSLIEGRPKTITITNAEVVEALSQVIDTIVQAIRVALERTPPELSSDLMDRGIVLTGGGALIPRLDQRITKEASVPVHVAEEPLFSVVTGAGKLLESPSLLQKVTLE